MKLSDKDKKLILFLVVFIPSAICFLLVIRPGITSWKEYHSDVRLLQQEKEDADTKLAQMDSLKKKQQEYVAEIQKAEKDYYSIMSSQKVDHMLTSIALDNALVVENFDVTMSKTPFQITPYPEAACGGEDPIEQSYISAACVTMTVSGREEMQQSFLDTLTNDYPAMRVTSFQWKRQKSDAVSSDSLILEVIQLTVNLELYMCEKVEDVK